MALGDAYATRVELKRRMDNMTVTTWDTDIDNALLVTSRGIEKVCHRQFNQTTTASARSYNYTARTSGLGVLHKTLAFVDDFHTTTGLVVKTDDGDDGSFSTTWTASDRQLEPLDGIVDGETGWPFWRLRAVDSRTFPMRLRRAPLQATAQWGWAAVPASVKEACLLVAEETFKLREAPFGVANMAEWGAVRVRANPMAMAMIAPYRRDAVLVA